MRKIPDKLRRQCMYKCIVCSNKFKPRKSTQKYCSQNCYWKDKVGKPSKKRSGKYIKCKTCGKEIYACPSIVGKKKYCSKDCGHKDNWGFKPRDKKCVICGQMFTIISRLNVHKKTCSKECNQGLRIKLFEKARKRDAQKVKLFCNICGKEYEVTRRATRRRKYKNCDECRYLKASEDRKLNGNPNYKIGLYVKRKRRSRQNTKHLYACQKYRKHYLKKNEYLSCEVCGKNENGTMQFQVHHIYSASRFPKHKELHNFKNLILCCLECHQKFHASKYKDVLKRLEEERGLKKLFDVRTGSRSRNI